MKHKLFTAGLLSLLTATPAMASDVEVHGFFLGTMSSRISDKPLNSGEINNYLLSEERLQLALGVDSDAGDTSIQAKVDFINDGVTQSNRIDIRELYAEYLADSYEVRIGRQMLTWGVADRLFINDVFPKDWSAFFAGQPLEYMKIASDMLKVSAFAGDWDVEMTLTPNAAVDIVPSPARYALYNPPGVTGVSMPASKADNAEAAMRLHSNFGRADVAFYASRGFWHQPDKGFDPTTGKVIYTRLNTYGVTVQHGLLGGIMSFEAGLYDSVDDANGNNPYIANSQQRWLIAYERDIAQDVTLGLQLYSEIMQDYDLYYTAAQGAFVAGKGPKPLAKNRNMATVNVRSLWLNQTLTASFFAMLVENGGEMYNPDMNYAVTDAFSVNGGAHWFTKGPESWLLGMMNPNDNLYMNVKWGF
ncbi:MAG: hypothetical protein R8M45_02505 [Ghiorsea sp.]